MDQPPHIKPSEIVNHLRYEFSERLRQTGVTWNKDGVLGAFDRAVGATAFWYADLKMEEHPKLEMPHHISPVEK